jgi:hypothetical protein
MGGPAAQPQTFMDCVRLAVAQPGKAIEVPDNVADDGTFKVDQESLVTVKLDGKRVPIIKLAKDTNGGIQAYVISGDEAQRDAGAEAISQDIMAETIDKGPGGFQQVISDAKGFQMSIDMDRRKLGGLAAAYTKVAQDPDRDAQHPFINAMLPQVQQMLRNRQQEAAKLAQAQIAMTAARAAVQMGGMM